MAHVVTSKCHLLDGGITDNLGLRGSMDRDYGWDSKERSPRFRDLVGSIARVPISRYSFETIELFRDTRAPREPAISPSSG